MLLPGPPCGGPQGPTVPPCGAQTHFHAGLRSTSGSPRGPLFLKHTWKGGECDDCLWPRAALVPTACPPQSILPQPELAALVAARPCPCCLTEPTDQAPQTAETRSGCGGWKCQIEWGQGPAPPDPPGGSLCFLQLPCLEGPPWACDTASLVSAASVVAHVSVSLCLLSRTPVPLEEVAAIPP